MGGTSHSPIAALACRRTGRGRAALAELEMTPEGADVFLEMLCSEGFLDAHPAVRERYRAIAVGNDRRGVYRATLAVIRRPDVLATLKAIAAPTLVLCGEAD